MDFDALTGGVEPGGLRVKNDIRLLICYLLSSINAPLSKQDIVQIMQENSLATYFEVMDSLAEMIQKGTIDTVSFNQLNEKEDCVICNDITRNIAKQLDSTLPISVRDCAVSAAFKLLAKAKREKENHVDIIETKQGYQVECHISGGEMDLMSFKIYVPDIYQARMVKEKFHENPQRIYSILLASVTDDKELLSELFQ